MRATDFRIDFEEDAAVAGLEPWEAELLRTTGYVDATPHVTERTPAATYRVLDLNTRKTVATGLSWARAHDYIELERAANPAARFDIRTETRQ